MSEFIFNFFPTRRDYVEDRNCPLKQKAKWRYNDADGPFEWDCGPFKFSIFSACDNGWQIWIYYGDGRGSKLYWNGFMFTDRGEELKFGCIKKAMNVCYEYINSLQLMSNNTYMDYIRETKWDEYRKSIE